MKMTPEEMVLVEGVEPEQVTLSEDEQNFFIDHGAEINWLLKKVHEVIRGEKPYGAQAAELAVYAFRMGREFERNVDSNGL